MKAKGIKQHFRQAEAKWSHQKSETFQSNVTLLCYIVIQWSQTKGSKVVTVCSLGHVQLESWKRTDALL